ncbi:Hypothetical predicted protein [Olea europaea subsp. europaea]|uniref:Uncharacterized protein n=1 Tax=Olea europaea subsp. europaea TaxID=158383 RepID=A0A8S0TU95_OLEEU|nr:Hypothetical predicted protein [Olea europaea subsp. europaea]
MPGKVPAFLTWPTNHATLVCLHPCSGQDASRTWPTYCVSETTKKCLKIRLRPYRILDMACTSCPKSCLEMPENQAASLPWPGHVLDMAYTPCPSKCPE